MDLIIVFLFWVVGFGAFSFALKRKINNWISRIKLPIFLKYYLILTPIIFLEEILTIEVPYFWGVLPILLSFYLLFFFIYLLQRFIIHSYKVIVFITGILGWINEFIFVGRIHQFEFDLTLIIMSILCCLIYSVMAIIPCYVLQEHIKEKN